MERVLNNIKSSIERGERLLAVLIDPDKIKLENVSGFIKKVNASIATHIFVGGSIVEEKATATLVSEVKKHTILPVILFPGDVSQITDNANAILFLSLLSGRKSDYLIEKHIQAVPQLRNSNLEVVPTGYILIENGKETTVQKVTKTQPLPTNNIQHITDTAKAGEFLGMQLIYLEAGSGALHPVPENIVKAVKTDLNVPLIVGGGIKTKEQLENIYMAGADLIVIGTAFENDESFFEELKK